MLQFGILRNKTTVARRSDAVAMRKMFVFLIVSALTLSVSNAQQIFVGGNLGVDYNGGKSTFNGSTNDEPSSFSVRFAPMAGYYINDDIAVGLKVKLGYTTDKQLLPFPANVENKTKQTYWGVSAFSRYNVWKLGKFTLSLEGSAGVVGVSTTLTTVGIIDDSTGASFSIDVVPLLSYSLTDRVSIESQFNFLNLGFSTGTSKDVKNPSNKTTHNSFNLGVNNSWEPFNWTVGLVFKL